MPNGRRTPGGVTRLSITVPRVLYEQYEEVTEIDSPSELVTRALNEAVRAYTGRPSIYYSICKLRDDLERQMTSKEVREFVVFTQTEPVEHILDMLHPHDTLPILTKGEAIVEVDDPQWCECEFTGDDDPHLS